MPPDEELIIRGKRKVNGEWVDVNEADQLEKEKKEPLSSPPPAITKEGVANAVKVQRAIRDLKTNAYFPPLAVADAVRDLISGNVGEKTGGIPIGTGELRNVLTNIGGKIGGGAGAFFGLPSGPGAIATSAAGYAAGSGIGSGIAQEFEKAAPNLFQSGYGSKENPDTPTDPSLSNAVRDTAMNALFDVGGPLALKGAKYFTPQKLGRFVTNEPVGKEAWKDLIEQIQIGKYNPLNKRPITPPINQEGIDAINAHPGIKTSVGQVLGEDNVFSRMQRFLLGEGENSLTKQQNKQIADELIDYRNQLGEPTPVLDKSGATVTGIQGLSRAQVVKEALSAKESAAYNEIPKSAKLAVVRTRPVIDPTTPENKFRVLHGLPPIASEPGTAKQVLGPIKLTGLNASFKTEGPVLDKMISEITDPALAGEVKLIRDRMAIGESDELLPWDTVREMEKQINRLSSNKNLPDSYRQQLNGIRATLVDDVEKNLSGQVKQTAKYWDKDALNRYHAAKGETKRVHDLYPEEITSAIKSAAGEVPELANIRGGNPETFFDDILKSEADALRLSRTGGIKDARTAFLQKLTNKYQNAETGILAGDKLLEELSSPKTNAISNILLGSADKQKLRWLAKLSAQVNPKIGRLGQLAIQQGQNDWSFNLPGDVLASVLGGKAPGLLKKGIQKVTVKLGGQQFAENFLNNDPWTRRLVNNIGKPVSRPGMAREIAEIVKGIQGAKLLIMADNKEYEYDTDTKELTEKKSALSQ